MAIDRTKRSVLKAAAALLLAPVAARVGAADTYPTRPIKLIVPFAAGGGTDLFARIVGSAIGPLLGQAVVVENRSGAGGNIGMEAAASAAADGYTLVLGHTGTLAINPALYAKIPYNPLTDFVPISMVAETSLVLLVGKDVPTHSVAELIALVKKEPGQINYASGGNGTGEHLSAELFRQMADLKMVHVPYNGSSAAMSALLGGQIQVFFSVLAPAVGHIQSGRVRALGVTSTKRLASLPNVPTIAEAGLPGYESVLRYGVLAPKATPQSVIETLHAAIVKAIEGSQARDALAKAGADPRVTTSDEFRRVIEQDLDKWGRIVRASGAHIG